MPGFQAFVISGVKFRLTRISASHAAGLGTGSGAGNWERSWEPGPGLGTGNGSGAGTGAGSCGFPSPAHTSVPSTSA